MVAEALGLTFTADWRSAGSILLLSEPSNRNHPLGLRHTPSRTSKAEKKRTADGRIVLEPQPDDSLNDPLNWSTWRRDSALLSLGFYCMIGGGMTPSSPQASATSPTSMMLAFLGWP